MVGQFRTGKGSAPTTPAATCRGWLLGGRSVMFTTVCHHEGGHLPCRGAPRTGCRMTPPASPRGGGGAPAEEAVGEALGDSEHRRANQPHS